MTCAVLIPKTPQWVRFAKMKVLAKQKEAGTTAKMREELEENERLFKERQALRQTEFDERRKTREVVHMHRSQDAKT